MKKKRTSLILLSAVLVASLLGGCGDKPTGGNVSETVQPTQHTNPILSTTTPINTKPITEPTDPTEETQPAPCLEPVTWLSAIKWRTIPQLLSLGEGKVLACRNYFEEGKGIVNYLDILDVYTDKVLAQGRNDSPRELVDEQFTDGSFVLRNPENNTFYVYNQSLKVTDKITAPNVDGWFSHDRKEYYFVDSNVLYRMNVASGDCEQINLEYDMRLESLTGVHPTRDIVIARFYISFYNENCGVCAIDCQTGKFVLLNETASHIWFDGDQFYAAVTNDRVYGDDIYCGNLSETTLQRAPADLLGSDTVSYSVLPGSGLLVHRTVDENNLSTTVYDLSQQAISSKLAQYDYLTATLAPIYLKQEQLIFGVYPDGYDYSPVVIDPKVLSYEKSLNLHRESWPSLVDKTVILNYQSEAEGPALPANLQAPRKKADALEEKYGVRILMENQTLGLCGSYAAVYKDAGQITVALDTLEEALALYPQGFLRQFQNEIGEGGLYFCLTGRIQGSLDPVGKAMKNRNRYEVLLDITADGLDKTIHHELWHAIEMKLSTDSFDHPQWHAINPEGFLYYGRYDTGYARLTQWTYDSSGRQCYFVDAYSRINSREDRARLMEYVMTEDASDLLKSPALREKLQIMSRTIRKKFDTTGWKTPHWERYI